MQHILTLTFSPCIDKSSSVPSLIPEKKLSCAPPKLEPGGGGINVARAIKKLGGKATAIYPAGGYTGSFFNQLLKNENIDSVIINTKNETRENIIILEESTNNQFRFGMPGNELTDEEWKKCLDAVRLTTNIEFIIASGSLPPGVPLNIFGELAKIAKTKNAKLIVDTSGEALKESLKEGVYLVKPNLGELSKLANKTTIEQSEIENIAIEFISKGKCEVMVVSLGAKGAMLITKDLTKFFTPPALIRKSTIGAGDSMVAGIVLYLSRGYSLTEAVRYGVACGSAATMNPGTSLCKKVDADKLYTEILEQ